MRGVITETRDSFFLADDEMMGAIREPTARETGDFAPRRRTGIAGTTHLKITPTSSTQLWRLRILGDKLKLLSCSHGSSNGNM